MLRETIAEIRTEAKRLGVPWAWVQEAKDMLLQAEKEKREVPNAIRRRAWGFYVGAYSRSLPFWRHGFRSRYRARLEKGSDFTCIHRYDLIAQVVMSEFPQFRGDHAGDVSGVQELWDFLLSDYVPLPERETLYWQALEMVRQQREKSQPQDDLAEVEF